MNFQYLNKIKNKILNSNVNGIIFLQVSIDLIGC